MKNKSIILHVGYPKTATSALQTFFKLNRDVLADAGVLYPVTGYTDYSGHIDLFHAIKKRKYSIFDKLLREINSFEGEKILLSSEYFFALEDHEIAEFLKHLPGFNVKAVAYVRRVDERVESGYIQVVRDSERRFSGDVWDYLAFLKKNPQRIDYKIFDELWCKHVGDENVIFRLYSKSVDVYNDFQNILGLNRELPFAIPGETVNDRIPRCLFDTLRLINSFIGDKYEHQDVLQQLLAIVEKDSTINKGKFSILTHDERLKINQMYSEQSVYISDKYSLDLVALSGLEVPPDQGGIGDSDHREVVYLLYRLWRTNKYINIKRLFLALKRRFRVRGRR